MGLATIDGGAAVRIFAGDANLTGLSFGVLRSAT